MALSFNWGQQHWGQNGALCHSASPEASQDTLETLKLIFQCSKVRVTFLGTVRLKALQQYINLSSLFD